MSPAAARASASAGADVSARVAFLRAVNVGGTGLVRKDELVALFEGAGLRDVRTHAASGNVLYVSSAADEDDRARIEAALAEHLAKPASAMVRKLADLEHALQAVRDAPTPGAGARVHLAFLERQPDAPLPDAVAGASFTRAGPREVLVVVDAAAKPGLDVLGPLERALSMRATVRTVGTVEKVAAKLG